MSSTASGATPSTLPPAILAQRYRLERRLAQGGMAEVWVATDLSLARQVAIKLLKPSLAADPVVAERFRREAIAVAQLSHPNIVAVYDAIEDRIGGEKRQAVVMQLVSGKSLRQLLDDQKRLSPDLTMHIGSCVAAALDCAHRANLVHRDVKPGNIMITADGRVLLTDFGIAKGLDAAGDDLTSPNIMMGTAKYLSPEQVRGRRLDGRADLYSLGLVLYECLAGRVPFLGETDADTALARLNRDPTDLTRLRPTMPDGLARLIHRMLARKPDDRFATGTDVRNELQRIASLPRIDPSLDTGAMPTTPSPTRVLPGSVTPRSTTPAHGATTSIDPPTPRSTPRTTGQVPAVARTGRPAGAPMRPDRTPPSTQRASARPNRQFENRRGPSLVVVGGLLLLAFIVAGVLLATTNRDNGDNGLPAGGGSTVAQPTSPGPIGGPVGIAAITPYDPNGDGVEFGELTPMLTDGNSTTAWHTECYANRFLGAKQQVGVVVDLGTASVGTLTVDIASAPFQLKVYGTADNGVPASFGAWGAPLQAFHDDTPGPVSVQVGTPTRFLLIAFNEVGSNNSCSADHPWQGALGEITFA